MILEELAKENVLYKEYIQSLEKQVKAYSQERNALNRQMESLGQDNHKLNRRISLQPQTTSEDAIQQLEDRFKWQCLKNIQLTSDLGQLRESYDQLTKDSFQKQRKIVTLVSENKIIEEYEIYKENIKKELQIKENIIREMQMIIIQLNQNQNKLKNRVQYLEQEDNQKAKILAQNSKQQSIINKISQRQSQTLFENESLKKKVNFLQQEIQSYHSKIQELEESSQKARVHIENIQDLNNRLINENKTQVISIVNLKHQLKFISQQKVELLSIIQSLNLNLNQSRLQVEQLSNELKQHFIQKVQQKLKSRTDNISKTQCQFNSAFKDLKVQIASIKNRQKESAEIQRFQGKQNNFSLDSPSKWKSVEGKLSILRNTNFK